MLNLKSQGLIGLLAVIVLLQDVQADSKETYLDRIETDKKQVENYIGLAGLELAEGISRQRLKHRRGGFDMQNKMMTSSRFARLGFR